jgi:hypothetical protein
MCLRHVWRIQSPHTSTDNPLVYRYMREKLGGAVPCVRPPVLSRDRYLQALFEMLLLSCTDLVVGRYRPSARVPCRAVALLSVLVGIMHPPSYPLLDRRHESN